MALPKNQKAVEQLLSLASRIDDMRGEGSSLALLRQYGALDPVIKLNPSRFMAEIRTEEGKILLDLNKPEYKALKDEAERIYRLFHPRASRKHKANIEPADLQTTSGERE